MINSPSPYGNIIADSSITAAKLANGKIVGVIPACGGKPETTSASYVDTTGSADGLIVPSAFPAGAGGRTYYFVAWLHHDAGGGTSYVKLRNVTDSVDECEMSYAVTGGKYNKTFISSALSLDSAKTYEVMIKSTANKCVLLGAVILVVEGV